MNLEQIHARARVERYSETPVEDFGVDEAYRLADLAPDVDREYQSEVYDTLCDYIDNEDDLIYSSPRKPPDWDEFRESASEARASEEENYEVVYAHYFGDDEAEDLKNDQLKMRLARSFS